MQTRAAAKKLAAAAATAAIVAGAADSAIGSSTEQADAVSAATAPVAPELTDNQGAPSKIAVDSKKRKRAAKKQAQPLKGGWVLPHGMGAAVAESDGPSPQDAEATLPALSLTNLPGGVEGPAHGVDGSSQSSAENTVTARTRQTRSSLQVSKAKADDQTEQKAKQEPTVKLEASDDLVIEQEDNHPSKRVRIALVPSKATPAPETGASKKGAPELAVVKDEQNKIQNQPAKVLIIKGIAFKDNLVVKTLDKIIIDATRILDPNFKLMVKRGKENPYGLTPGFSPYPYRRVPTSDACEEVHRILTELHGEVKQPEKMPAASLEVAGCGEVPCVLDALLRTLISGNTLMSAADAAIKNLSQHYGLRKDGTGAGSIDWDKARLSSHNELAQVIRVAGNGPKRSHHIKQILDMVYEENLEQAKQPGSTVQKHLSLDHMHGMTKDEALAKFVGYPGIGIKTAACVTLFCLRLPCFAVDTHVHKFCRWLGWVPEKADPDNCFRHGDFMVPDHLKYGLHQLFIRHGQLCFKCRKATKPGSKDWNEAPDCPLEHLLDRSKDEAGSKVKPPRKAKKESSSQDDEDVNDDEDVDDKEDADDKKETEGDQAANDKEDTDEDTDEGEDDEEEDEEEDD